MIRSKKENTTKTRKLERRVPVDQLPNLMRAMGYYPTQQEIVNMMNEVRFSSYTTMGEPNLWVDLPTFIKLFVNHRPVYGIGKNNIEDAFKALTADSEHDVGQGVVLREDLQNLLASEGDGEEITTREL
jgi:Ca2+-binding EF-hand superfamily protein